MENKKTIIARVEKEMQEINGKLLEVENKIKIQTDEINKTKDTIKIFNELQGRQTDMLILFRNNKQKLQTRKSQLHKYLNPAESTNSESSDFLEEKKSPNVRIKNYKKRKYEEKKISIDLTGTETIATDVHSVRERRIRKFPHSVSEHSESSDFLEDKEPRTSGTSKNYCKKYIKDQTGKHNLASTSYDLIGLGDSSNDLDSEETQIVDFVNLNDSREKRLRTFWLDSGIRVITMRYYQCTLYVCGTNGYLGHMKARNLRTLQLNTTEDVINVIGLKHYVYAFTHNEMIIFDKSKNTLLQSFVFNGLFRPILVANRELIIIPLENGEIWKFNCITNRRRIMFQTSSTLKGFVINDGNFMFFLNTDGTLTCKSCDSQYKSFIKFGCLDIYPGIRKEALCIFESYFSIIDPTNEESRDILLSNINLFSSSKNAFVILDSSNQLMIYKLTIGAGFQLLRKMPIPVEGEVSAIHVSDCEKVFIAAPERLYEFYI